MPAQLSWIRKVSRIGTWLSLRLFFVEMGRDAFGNRYFRARKTKAGQRERRSVFYANDNEASQIPAKWYSWLHHTTAAPLSEESPFHQKWEKEREINPTGTEAAWLPPGHALKRQERKSGPVSFWSPASHSDR